MSTSSITSASNIQMDYMKLLIAQLQNQNPLEPMDNNQMASQLAEFSQLQQLESMNTNFAEVLATSKRSYANSLLGKKITFYWEDEITGELESKLGTVESTFDDPDSDDNLLWVKVAGAEGVKEYTLDLDAVVSVAN